MPSGRLSSYTQATADAICERMANGESLSQVCADDSMPCMSTVLRWERDIEGFSAQYARAREDLQAHWAADILRIADTPQLGVKTETKGEEVKTIEGDMLEHRKLQIDARKWLLSKLAPKKYGERLDLTHANPDGTNLAAPVVAITLPAESEESKDD